MWYCQFDVSPVNYSDSDSDGNIFNLRRLQAKTKVQTDVLDELLYADDMGKNASSEAKMQTAMDQVSQSCVNTNQHMENRTMNQSLL